jgi:hypothetical protein
MTEIDDVLQRVARGELTPDDALALLGPEADPEPEVEGDAPPGPPPVQLGKAPVPPPDDPTDAGRAGDDRWPRRPEPPSWPSPPPPYQPPPAGERPKAEGPGSGVRTVRVRTLAKALEIYADPAVAEVQVTRGSPSLRREGDAIVVAHGSAEGPGARFSFVDTLRSIPGFDERTVLRVNPDLELDVDVSATSLRIWGCEGGLRLRLAASSAKFDRVAGPVTLDCHSSSVKGSARFTGESHIRCESSSIKLGLLDGTDVKIKATNRMGKVVLPRHRSKSAGQAHGYAVVGEGTGLVIIDATMSSVVMGGEW